jgi:Spondin_N
MTNLIHPMLKTPSTLLPAALGLSVIGFAFASMVEPADAAASVASSRSYEVTITNLSSNQIISPPILATHDDSARMFTPGMAASAELAAIAEDGDNSAMANLLASNSGVFDIVTAGGGIAPGTSITLTIEANGAHRWFSMAGMFVTTNDAFLGVDSMTIDEMAIVGKFFVPVWDAGSEANSENGMYIPGPPFGNGGMHDPAPSEGFVHLHSGIHGILDVLPETYGWGSYGALVEFKRL